MAQPNNPPCRFSCGHVVQPNNSEFWRYQVRHMYPVFGGILQCSNPCFQCGRELQRRRDNVTAITEHLRTLGEKRDALLEELRQTEELEQWLEPRLFLDTPEAIQGRIDDYEEMIRILENQRRTASNDLQRDINSVYYLYRLPY